MRIDLHTHSSASDGTDTPADLVRAAAAAGLDVVALTARWIEQPVEEGRFFKLDTATVSTLGYERDFPVVLRWNS